MDSTSRNTRPTADLALTISSHNKFNDALTVMHMEGGAHFRIPTCSTQGCGRRVTLWCFPWGAPTSCALLFPLLRHLTAIHRNESTQIGSLPLPSPHAPGFETPRLYSCLIASLEGVAYPSRGCELGRLPSRPPAPRSFYRQLSYRRSQVPGGSKTCGCAWLPLFQQPPALNYSHRLTSSHVPATNGRQPDVTHDVRLGWRRRQPAARPIGHRGCGSCSWPVSETTASTFLSVVKSFLAVTILAAARLRRIRCMRHLIHSPTSF